LSLSLVLPRFFQVSQNKDIYHLKAAGAVDKVPTVASNCATRMLSNRASEFISSWFSSAALALAIGEFSRRRFEVSGHDLVPRSSALKPSA
jgi:hypothetical protein